MGRHSRRDAETADRVKEGKPNALGREDVNGEGVGEARTRVAQGDHEGIGKQTEESRASLLVKGKRGGAKTGCGVRDIKTGRSRAQGLVVSGEDAGVSGRCGE